MRWRGRRVYVYGRRLAVARLGREPKKNLVPMSHVHLWITANDLTSLSYMSNSVCAGELFGRRRFQ